MNPSLFPIRNLSEQTGVNTVTLRAWERRYGLLTPQRSAKGHRLYSLADVERVESILQLMERGVPVSKVKAMLEVSADTMTLVAEDEHLQVVDDLTDALVRFRVNKVATILNDTFSSYPISVCRQRLFEPVTTQLLTHEQGQAQLSLLETELIYYFMNQLRGANLSRGHVTLTIGSQASTWRVVLLALELINMSIDVYLFVQPIHLPTLAEISETAGDSTIVYVQDGTFKPKEREQLAAMLNQYKNLIGCGTAPSLTELVELPQIYPDITTLMSGLKVRFGKGGTE